MHVRGLCSDTRFELKLCRMEDSWSSGGGVHHGAASLNNQIFRIIRALEMPLTPPETSHLEEQVSFIL